MLVNAETVYGTRALKQKYFFSKKVRFYRTQKLKIISIPSSVISILSLTTRDLRQMYPTPNYDKKNTPSNEKVVQPIKSFIISPGVFKLTNEKMCKKNLWRPVQ